IKLVWGYIKDTFSNTLKFLKALVTLDFKGMKDAIKTQMNLAKQLIRDIWAAIKENIGAKLKEILSDVKSKFIEIKNNIQNKMNEAKTSLVNKFTEMVSSTREKASEIVTAGKEKFEEFKNAVRDKLTEAVSVVGQKIGEMPDKVMEFFGKMADAGKQLIAGLINGIKQMGAKAVEAVTGVVDGVVSKAKSLLKIKSPSRVFMEIGGFISEGAEDGLDKMSGLAAKASENLGLGVEDAFNPRLATDGLDISNRVDGINRDVNGRISHAIEEVNEGTGRPIYVQSIV